MNGWGKRRRWVYGYRCIDMRQARQEVRWGYVGKTSSKPTYRDAQHRNDKDWSWAIRGSMVLLYDGYCGRISLWFREIYWIWKLNPMFNVDWNKMNPDRITPWQARALYKRAGAPYPR
ncbi:MAG: hypothetical protein JXA67_20430 [Micromonosporaceae bacterium]|nr:hypothetical protein [Micromonosporaceae bacterium]